MKSQILVGAEQFMLALGAKSLKARDSLYVQAMTFEGDAAGEKLIDLMIASPAKDKRIIIDSFSKVVVSDHFVFGFKYLRDSAFRAEVKNTNLLVQKAQLNGVKVKFVNPTGPLMLQYPLRNHKKMMVVDKSCSYLGGINFSDHNFAWHDMMVEMEDSFVCEALSRDFLLTWTGFNQSNKESLQDEQLFFLNGIKSRELYQDLFDLVRSANSTVSVVSPYVSEPLLAVLKEVSKSGVEVQIISPRENNKGLFYDYLLSQCEEGSFKLFHYPGMFHLKAMLIDDSKLIFGSSNYDLISYHFEQEVVMISQNTLMVDDFRNEILNPMKQTSVRYEPMGGEGTKAKLVMKLLKRFCGFASTTVLKPH